jgi:hypothetical protein
VHSIGITHFLLWANKSAEQPTGDVAHFLVILSAHPKSQVCTQIRIDEITPAAVVF